MKSNFLGFNKKTGEKTRKQKILGLFDRTAELFRVAS